MFMISPIYYQWWTDKYKFVILAFQKLFLTGCVLLQIALSSKLRRVNFVYKLVTVVKIVDAVIWGIVSFYV